MNSRSLLKCCLVCVALVVVLGCAGAVKDPFVGIQPSSVPDYGYSAENPIRIGYHKDPFDNIPLSHLYISCLRTADGRRLEEVFRASVDDPVYDPSAGGFLGLSQRGAIPKGGILDEYVLVPEGTSDTLTLYFDIYHKAPLAVPDGLLFEVPGDGSSVKQP